MNNPTAAEQQVAAAIPAVESEVAASNLSPKVKHIAVVLGGAAVAALAYLAQQPQITEAVAVNVGLIEVAFFLSDKE